MATRDICNTLKLSFAAIVERHGLEDKPISVKAESGAMESPPHYGAEVKLTARFEGVYGECYTSFPGEYDGPLSKIPIINIEDDPVGRSVFIAALNAVMNKYEMADECLHCDEEDEAQCAERILQQYVRNNGKVNFLLAGYQPHMAKAIATHFPLRILDLDPDNIGKTVHGVTIEDGTEAYADATLWAEVILCSGSSIANGTFFDYVRIPKDVKYYGTTIAGAARALELSRICPFGKNG